MLSKNAAKVMIFFQ